MAVMLNGHGASYTCLSTDTKPASAEMNALLLELDTGDFYYFDGTDWLQVGVGA